MRCRGARPLAAGVLLSVLAGCTGTDLGQIDETRAERDDMSGPGIFADDSGETALKWQTGGDEAAPAGQAPSAAVVDERAEFELFKEWRRLRTEGADSPEYREFLQWLEYREFKSSQ